jgi:hypothetical protein
MQLTQHAQTIEAGQEKVEDHQVVRAAHRPLEAVRSVIRPVHVEPLGLQRTRQERQDSGLVLYHEDPEHLNHVELMRFLCTRTSPDDLHMTWE